jgi:hypothetical protein
MVNPFVQALHTMRIPSQFTDDSLYRRENRQRGTGDGRRLTHMVIALALVLVLMQKASQPEIYESFFGALTPVAPEAPTQLSATELAADTTSNRIDPRVTARVVDGTVWRSADFDALHMFLSDAKDHPTSDGPMVGVLPLLQQPDVFLNKVVRSGGRVARSERIDAQQNELGITEYWQLWIRPAAGVDRPLVAIVPAVPDSVAAVGANATDQNGPDVVVVGRFLKRLAYQSVTGADLAPVVVGRLAATDVMNAADAVPIADKAAQSRTTLWILLGLSTLCGLSLATLAMWRTSVAANRTRLIRSSRADSPNLFLQSLSATASEDQSEYE